MGLPNNRVCFSCKINKPLTETHFYRSNKRYYQRECKECNRLRRARWWKSEKGKISSANTKLKRRFGLTLTDFERLLKVQGSKCAICGATYSYGGQRLAVDHDHKTGEIRGLLCKACNVGLGNFNESVEILEKAVQYVLKQGVTK